MSAFAATPARNAFKWCDCSAAAGSMLGVRSRTYRFLHLLPSILGLEVVKVFKVGVTACRY